MLPTRLLIAKPALKTFETLHKLTVVTRKFVRPCHVVDLTLPLKNTGLIEKSKLAFNFLRLCIICLGFK